MEHQWRSMRRSRQQLSAEECVQVLERGSCGVLAVCGDDGYPYAVPLSYVYEAGKIYLHSAMKGHKIDALRMNPRVSFCVVDQDTVSPAEFTTYFRSVIVFGHITIHEPSSFTRIPLYALGRRYGGDSVTQEDIEAEIQKSASHALILKLTPEHITGKQSIEMVNGHMLPPRSRLSRQ